MRSFAIYFLTACLVFGCGGPTVEDEKINVITISIDDLDSSPASNPGRYKNMVLRISGTLIFESYIRYWEGNSRGSRSHSLNTFSLFKEGLSGKHARIFSRANDPDTMPWTTMIRCPYRVILVGRIEWINKIGPHDVPGQWAFFITKYESIN